MKKFFQDFGLGVSTTFQGFGFAFNNKMGHFFLYPLIMTIAIAIAAYHGMDAAVEWANAKILGWLDLTPIPGDSIWDMVISFLKSIAEYVIRFLIWIICVYTLHKTIKYIVLILMSPVMALISEQTEKVLTGNTYAFNFGQFAKDVWRGILLACRNFVVEMSLILLIWLANLALSSIFPPLTIILTPAAWLLSLAVGSYFWGFATMDYTNERRRLKLRDSVRFIRANKGLAIGNGLMFTLLLSIPLIGTYVGPILAIVMCTVGATLAIHKRVDLQKRDYILVKESDKKSGAISE